MALTWQIRITFTLGAIATKLVANTPPGTYRLPSGRSVRVISWPTAGSAGTPSTNPYGEILTDVPDEPGPAGKMVPRWVNDKWATKLIADTIEQTTLVRHGPTYVDIDVVG
jgi:hypothetical protein